MITEFLNKIKKNSFWQKIMKLKLIYQIILIIFILILFTVIVNLITYLRKRNKKPEEKNNQDTYKEKNNQDTYKEKNNQDTHIYIYNLIKQAIENNQSVYYKICVDQLSDILSLHNNINIIPSNVFMDTKLSIKDSPFFKNNQDINIESTYKLIEEKIKFKKYFFQILINNTSLYIMNSYIFEEFCNYLYHNNELFYLDYDNKHKFNHITFIYTQIILFKSTIIINDDIDAKKYKFQVTYEYNKNMNKIEKITISNNLI